MSFIKRSLGRVSKHATGLKCGDKEGAKRWPAIIEFLTCDAIDGVPRQTATMTVFFNQNGFTCFFRDREEDMSLPMSADTLLGLLDALEANLVSDRPNWRQNLADGTTTRKKKA